MEGARPSSKNCHTVASEEVMSNCRKGRVAGWSGLEGPVLEEGEPWGDS